MRAPALAPRGMTTRAEPCSRTSGCDTSLAAAARSGRRVRVSRATSNSRQALQEGRAVRMLEKRMGRSTRLLEVAWLSSLALACARPACAEVEAGAISAAVTLTSDYLFRGYSQTKGAPALQAGLDY